MRYKTALVLSTFMIASMGGLQPGRAREGSDPPKALLLRFERAFIGTTALDARSVCACLSGALLEHDVREVALRPASNCSPQAAANVEGIRHPASEAVVGYREIVAAAILAGLRLWREVSCRRSPNRVPAVMAVSASEQSRLAAVSSNAFDAGFSEVGRHPADISAVVEPMSSQVNSIETPPEGVEDAQGEVAPEPGPRSEALPNARGVREPGRSADPGTESASFDAFCPHRREPANRCGKEARVADASGFLPPLHGSIVRRFGEREGGRRLRGLILSSNHPQQIVAPADGVVAYAGPFRGMGSLLIIEHRDAYHSLVIGASRLEVRAGDVVTKGQVIGWVAQAPSGSADVYVELRRAGEPIDPMSLLSALEGEVRG